MGVLNRRRFSASFFVGKVIEDGVIVANGSKSASSMLIISLHSGYDAWPYLMVLMESELVPNFLGLARGGAKNSLKCTSSFPLFTLDTSDTTKYAT